jgi:hypothetical protein
VTSGTVGTLTSSPTPQVNYYRSWNGVDGKVESYGGKTRVKWNSYTSTAASRLLTDATFLLQRRNGPVTYNLSSLSMLPDGSLPGLTAAEQSRLLSRLLEKVKGHSFNLGVNLGQMKQTVNLLSDNLGHLGRSAAALVRKDFAGAARELGVRPKPSRLHSSDVSGRWLELQYGWLPLLSDSFEAAKAFEAISNGPRTARFVVATSKKWVNDISHSPSHFSAIWQGAYGRRIQYEMYEEMSFVRQLGLIDPLSVAWELTPWSFVLDWFFPVGDYLDLLHQIPSLKGRWLVTDFHRLPKQPIRFEWRAARYGGTGPNYDVLSVVDPPDSVQLYTKLSRVFSASPPKVPFPQFNLQGISSSRRFWNALGLAHQRFGKAFRKVRYIDDGPS